MESIMSFFKSIILSLSMFSAIPMPRIEWNQKNMRYMMCTFPFVGLVIAFLCGGWFIFGQFLARWHKNLSPALIALGFTLIPVFVSGGIHLDGFMDTCDALGSHASREKKLEILKDSHSGAFAVLGCVIYFLCYFVLSLEVFKQPLHLINLAPFLGIFVISRILSAFAVSTFPIAKDSGLVHTFATATIKNFTALWCSFWLILISMLQIYFFNYLGIALVAICLSVFCLYFVMAVKNFGGITGDTAGWFVQLCEISALAVFAIML